jgi:hypothetical protein
MGGIMPSFGILSSKRLTTCKPELIRLANEVIKYADCTVLWGFRDKREQEKAFVEGKSKLHFPHSAHNRYPSRGIDLAPYPIDWSDIRRFYYFGGYVIGVAHRLEIPIRWGGDWDGDFQVKDQNFNDLVHFELV